MMRWMAAGVLFLMAAAPAARREPQALTARWSFAEGAGLQAGDSSGSGVHGTLAGGAAWVSGRTGYGVSFDGINDAVTLGSNLPILQNTSAATMSAWVNLAALPASGAFQEIVSISVNAAATTNTSRLALSLKGDGTAADIFAGGRSTDTEAQQTATADANLAINTWYHLAAVVDFAGDQIRIYKNGTLVLTQAVNFTAAATPATAPTNGALGAQDKGDSNFFRGVLDEVQIWQRALAETEIQSLAKPEALGAHWKLDDAAGAVAADAGGQNHPGAVAGGAAWVAGMDAGALSFDGTDDRIALPENLSILQNVNAASVACWVRPGSTIPAGAFRELFSLSVNSANPSNTSRLAFALRGDGTGGDIYAGGRSADTEGMKSLADDSNLAVGQWVHLCAVIDFAQGRITLFRNGVVTASGAAPFSQPRTANTPSRNAAIGAQDTGDSNYFHGDLDDLRVYARPLDACEVQKLAGSGGLRAHWTLDDGAGLTAADASGNGFPATLKNGPAWVPGTRAGAIQFDGGNDYLDLGADKYMVAGVKAATLATWVNLSSLPANNGFYELISLSVKAATATSNTSRMALALRGDGTAADVTIGGRSTDTEMLQSVTADANLAAGAWRHVAAVVDYKNDLLTIFVDGVQIGQGAVNFLEESTPLTPSTSSAIGAQDSGDSNYFHGLLDDIRVYGRALSGAEIAELALVATPGAPTGLIGTAGNAQATLQWTAVPGATNYTVKRSTTAGSGHVAVANVGTTSFVNVGLTNYTAYYYIVTASNAAGESGPSNEVSITPVPGPPAVPVILSPSHGSFVTDPAPLVSGSSGTSGFTITLFVDGQVAGLGASGAGGSWAIRVFPPMSEGIHTLTAWASDEGQTSALSAPVQITIDSLPPLISSVQPPDGSTQAGAGLVISASWSDETSGLELTTGYVEVDGFDVTASATLAPGGFTYTPIGLDPGAHLVSVRILDRAGLQTVRTWAFNVTQADSTFPVITSIWPAYGERILDQSAAVIIYYDDYESGIDPASFSVLLDNSSSVLNWVVTPTYAYYLAPPNFQDGLHQLSVWISDYAGNTTFLYSEFRIAEAVAMIPGSGGSLESLDPARPGYRTRFEAPSGISDELTTLFHISIEHAAAVPTLPAGFVAVGPGMRFETPTSFLAPVKLSLPYQEGLLPPGSSETGLRVLKWLGSWTLVPALPVDTAGNRVSTEVMGISSEIFIAVAQIVGSSETSADIDVVPLEVIADGQHFSIVSIVPRDQAGRILGPGQDVQLVQVTGSAMQYPVQDVGDGVYRVRLASTTPQVVTLSVSVNTIPVLRDPPPQIVFLSRQPHHFTVTLPSQTRAGEFISPVIQAIRATGEVDLTFEGLVQILVTGTQHPASGTNFPSSLYVFFSPRDRGVVRLDESIAFVLAGRQSVTAFLVLDPAVRGRGEITVLSAERVTTFSSPTTQALEDTVFTGTVGTTLPMPLIFKTVDLFGNPIPGRPISLTISSGSAQFVNGPGVSATFLSNPVSLTTDASGLAVGPFVRLPASPGSSAVYANHAQLLQAVNINLTFHAVPLGTITSAPVITQPSAGVVLVIPRPTIEGSGTDGWKSVPVIDVLQFLGPADVTAGVWSVQGPLLGQGAHSVYAFLRKASPVTGQGQYLTVRAPETIFTVDAVAPPVPVILTPAKKTNDVMPRIEGTAGAGAVSIRLMRDHLYIAGEVPVVGGVWVVDDAENPYNTGTRTFTALAIDANGQVSAESAPVQIEIDTTPPAAPAGLSASPGNGFVLLSWPPSESLDTLGYNLWRRPKGQSAAAFQKINVSALIAGNRYCDRGVDNNNSYEYQVTAVDDALNEAGNP